MTRIKQCSKNRLLVNNDYVLNEMPETIYRMAYILDISTRREEGGIFINLISFRRLNSKCCLGIIYCWKGQKRFHFNTLLLLLHITFAWNRFQTKWWMDDVRKQRNHFRLQCLSNRSKVGKKKSRRNTNPFLLIYVYSECNSLSFDGSVLFYIQIFECNALILIK